MSPLDDVHTEDRVPNAKALLFGHIRLGIYRADLKPPRPVQSDTFIFTSADERRLANLAEDFGGEVERYEPQGAGEEPYRVITETDAFTAIFPFPRADHNLTQDWELWGAGGIKRSCNGYDATVIEVDEETGQVDREVAPCICNAQESRECAPVTRLRLLLPQTGWGLWELRTPSKIAADALYDQVGFIAALAEGRMNQLPIRVVYAPRKIRFYDEKKKRRSWTTKRVVSLSIAGDAARVAHILGAKPDAALLASVRASLEDAGRTLELDGGKRAALGSGAEPAEATGPDADTRDEVPPAPPDDSGPPTEEQWEEAKKLYRGRVGVIREANKLWKVATADAITAGQMRELIEAKK